MFTKSGGQLAGSGAVAWQFEPRGLIAVPRDGVDADEVALTAIDAGAEDVDTEDRETIEIYTSPGDLERVRTALEARRRTGRVGRVDDGRQADRRARFGQGAAGAAARRAARGPRGRASASRPTSTSPRTSSPRSPGDRPRDRPGDRRTWIRDRRTDGGPAARGRPRLSRHQRRTCRLPERLLAIHALVDELIELPPAAISSRSSGCSSRRTSRRRSPSDRRAASCCSPRPSTALPVREATPNEVKSRDRRGTGAADKEQVSRMVQLVLGCPSGPHPTTRPMRSRSRSGRRTRGAGDRIAHGGGARPRRRGADHPRRRPATTGPSARPWPRSARSAKRVRGGLSPAVIASVEGIVGAVALDSRRHRGRRHRLPGVRRAGDPRVGRARWHAQAAHLPPGPRGPAGAVRVPHRRGARVLQPAADRDRRGAEGGARDRRLAADRRPPARDHGPGPGGARVDPGDRQEARRADHLRAQGEGRRGRRRAVSGVAASADGSARPRARSSRRSRRSATRWPRPARPRGPPWPTPASAARSRSGSRRRCGACCGTR